MSIDLDIGEMNGRLMAAEASEADRLWKMQVVACLKEVSLANIEAVREIVDRTSEEKALSTALRVLERTVMSMSILDHITNS